MTSYRSIPVPLRKPGAPAEALLIRVYRIPPREIGYLTSLMEASDGIGLIRTLDRSRGIIECWIMADFLEDFEALLRAVSKEFPVQSLPREFE